MPVQFFLAGLDPTGQPNLSAAQYLQMVQEGGVNTGIGLGLVLKSTAAPSTVDWPQAFLENVIWMDDTGVFHYFVSAPATWAAQAVGDDAITSADQISNGIITINKLFAPSSSGGFVLRINGGSTAFELVAPGSIIPNGSLAIAAIVPGDPNTFLYVNGTGVLEWKLFSIVDELNLQTNVVNPSSIQFGAALSILRTNAGRTGNEWVTLATLLGSQTVPLASLVTGGSGNAGKTLAVGADGSVTLVTASSQVNTYRTPVPSYAAVPVLDNAVVTFSHGLTVQPDQFWFTLVNVTPEYGYVANDEVNFPVNFQVNSNYTTPAAYANATLIGLAPFPWLTSEGAGGPTVYDRAVPGTLRNITPANWRIKGYAVKFP